MMNWASCPRCGRKFFKYEDGSKAVLNIKCGGCKALVDVELGEGDTQTRVSRPTIKFKLDPGAYAPSRAHPLDAGIDLRTPRAFHIAPDGGEAVINTGVHVGIPAGFVGFLKSKSGLNVKYGIVGEGVIDAGYTGSIVVKLYNHSSEPLDFEAGQKIIQLVILPVRLGDVEIVNEISSAGGDRGDSGFGSTGK